MKSDNVEGDSCMPAMRHFNTPAHAHAYRRTHLLSAMQPPARAAPGVRSRPSPVRRGRFATALPKPTTRRSASSCSVQDFAAAGHAPQKTENSPASFLSAYRSNSGHDTRRANDPRPCPPVHRCSSSSAYIASSRRAPSAVRSPSRRTGCACAATSSVPASLLRWLYAFP